MQEDQAKTFCYSDNAMSLRRRCLFVLSFGLAITLLTLWSLDAKVEYLIMLGLLAIAGLGGFALSFRNPVAVLFGSRAMLRRYWHPGFTQVSYSQICCLEKIGTERLIVVYQDKGNKRKANVPLRWVNNGEELERALRSVTGLTPQVRYPSYWKILTILESFGPPEEIISWRFVVYVFSGVFAGIILTIALIGISVLQGWGLRADIFAWIPVVTGFALPLYLLLRRRGKR